MNKRVLIITYYWPPSGGAGVQRWLKFAKFLPSKGWQPVIYTPENPELALEDRSLAKDIPEEAEIIKTNIWEPYDWYKKLSGKKGKTINAGFSNEGKKAGLIEKSAIWLRGNLFIPDARKYWIRPSIKFLSSYLKSHPVDAIISTGPPHSMHLIALGLKHKFNLKWIADFRDPWTNIDFYQELKLTGWANSKHHRLELEVLQKADAVIAVGQTMADEFDALSHRKINVITNGYDADDLKSGAIERDVKFSIAHIGTLSKTRNPVELWKVLDELVKSDQHFAAALEIKIVGQVDFHVKQSLSEYHLTDYINYIPYLKHDDVANVQQRSQVLLLVLNDTPNAKGILTGKFFEYMAALRPILCIGRPDGDAAKIIRETMCGEVCAYDETAKMKDIIISYFTKFQKGTLNGSENNIEQYSRASLTNDLVTLLNSI